MKGEVISIIGAPGSGKSFLVKQLACKQCLPAFFEGEEGIFPEDVINVLNSEQDSHQRFQWLLNRTKKILEHAREIANNGMAVFVDGDVLQVQAWLDAEIGDKSPAVLNQWLKENMHLQADKVIILHASLEKLLANRESRGRLSEQNDFIKQRSERIQAAALKLIDSNIHARILDRSNLEFTDGKTLDNILEFISKIPNRES